MTLSDLGTLIARTFALFLLFKGVAFILHVLSFTAVDPYIAWLYGVQFAAYVLFAALFWCKAETLGAMIAGKAAGKEISAPPPSLLMSVVFTGFGLWMMTKTVPSIALLAAHYINNGMIEGHKVSPLDYWEVSLSIFLHLVLAAFLLFGSKGLQRLILNLRDAGLDKGNK